MNERESVEREVVATPVGLSFAERVTFEHWERAGRQIARVVNSSAWYLGDWLVFGQDRYEGRYQQSVAELGLEYQTLRNYARVARGFPYPRRRVELSFQHHAEVAALPPQEQDRWLDAAQRGGWSRNALRAALRGSKRDDAGWVVLPKVSVTNESVQRWRHAASRTNAELEVWIVRSLDRAAETTPGAGEHRDRFATDVLGVNG
ncbi:LmbU family transcriptional regulator [Saccharothrix sp. S26]|uniref:LmbU family transcriptional regulator n=1 Tax=Saccharothrix sp. S26 TaxID=2907215 RepID=UPI001F3BF9EF|nr:LmbU family transcriptional regulator [Saccharothrix sp. S26]MCE7001088.1 LmbU family transcriptional regulator [Saccharothrix sp. S26]